MELVMIILYSGIGIGFIILFHLSSHFCKKISAARRNPFHMSAEYLYRKGCKQKLFRAPWVEKDLKTLKPGCGGKSETNQYYIEKLALLLLIIFVGNITALSICLAQAAGGILKEGKLINRNTYGMGSVEADLQAEITVGSSEETDRQEEPNKKKSEKFTVIVQEKKYGSEEIIRLGKEAERELSILMLGNNPSVEEVSEKLELVKAIEGYPFRISWESDNYELVDSDGNVTNDKVKGAGEVVEITAVFIYDDYREEHIYAVRICPKYYTEEEEIRKNIEESVRKQEEGSRQKDWLILPEKLGELRIHWVEKKKNESAMFFLLFLAAAAAVYLLKDKDLHEKVKLRNRQMLYDYPGVVMKLTLYMGAGMTIRNAFKKIAYDYREEKKTSGKYKYVYEEMLLVCHELDSGISEAAAYEHFGKRCLISQYIRLGALLSQNLRKGNKTLLEELKQEAFRAFEERKNTAKKLGEEAGTKLLLPMMLMLSVIMVLIMVPAYLSFSV